MVEPSFMKAPFASGYWKIVFYTIIAVEIYWTFFVFAIVSWIAVVLALYWVVTTYLAKLKQQTNKKLKVDKENTCFKKEKKRKKEKVWPLLVCETFLHCDRGIQNAISLPFPHFFCNALADQSHSIVLYFEYLWESSRGKAIALLNQLNISKNIITSEKCLFSSGSWAIFIHTNCHPRYKYCLTELFANASQFTY